MYHLTLSVSSDDIHYGRVGSSTDCPIALAAQRVFKGAKVLVSNHSIHVIPPHRPIIVWDIPVEAKAFIQDYDDYKAVKPFTFGTSPLFTI